jgi:hypothetical protein
MFTVTVTVAVAVSSIAIQPFPPQQSIRSSQLSSAPQVTRLALSFSDVSHQCQTNVIEFGSRANARRETNRSSPEVLSDRRPTEFQTTLSAIVASIVETCTSEKSHIHLSCSANVIEPLKDNTHASPRQDTSNLSFMFSGNND